MSRLTYWCPDGMGGGEWRANVRGTEVKGEEIDRLAAYEDTGLAPDTIKSVFGTFHESDRAELEELRGIIRAKHEGRLVVLPCKVGDTVYEVHNNSDACATCQHYSSWFGTDVLCDNPEIDAEKRDYPNLAKHPLCEKQFMEVIEYKVNLDSIFFSRDKFGKTVFLTREEAEAALKEETP